MDSLNGIKAINTDIFFKNFYFIVVTLYRCHFAWWIAARYNKYDVMISVLEPNGSICYFSVLKSTSICSHIGVNKCTPLICLYICSCCTRRTLNMVSSRHKKIHFKADCSRHLACYCWQNNPLTSSVLVSKLCLLLIFFLFDEGQNQSWPFSVTPYHAH